MDIDSHYLSINQSLKQEYQIRIAALHVKNVVFPEIFNAVQEQSNVTVNPTLRETIAQL